MMRVIVSVYRASSATFEKVNSYQLPLFSSQGIYKSDYSQLNRKRLILCSISRPGPALRRPGEGGKETHHGEPSGALWGILCYFMCYFCYWNLSPMFGRLKVSSDQ